MEDTKAHRTISRGLPVSSDAREGADKLPVFASISRSAFGAPPKKVRIVMNFHVRHPAVDTPTSTTAIIVQAADITKGFLHFRTERSELFETPFPSRRVAWSG